MYLSYSVKTSVGQKRDHNEDYVTFFDPAEEQDLQRSGRIFIVADGVGGASYGERASRYAAEKVRHDYFNLSDIPPGSRLPKIIQDAGNQINSFAEEGERFLRMATTMVATVIIDDTLLVANVGDSRAYLIRDGVANQLSKDHSLVSEMVRDGLITEEEARTSKRKNRITRSLGGERDVRVDVFEGIKLSDGDKIVLCSDGFSQYATNEMIVQLTQNGTADEITDRMIAHANQQGGSDNISVILIKVSSSPLSETVSMRRAARDLSVMPSLYEERDTDHGVENQASFWKQIMALSPTKKIGLLSLSFLAVFVFAVVSLILINQTSATNPLATVNLTPPEQNQSSYPNDNTPSHSYPNDGSALVTEVTVTVTLTPPPNRCRYQLTQSDFEVYQNAMPNLLSTKFNTPAFTQRVDQLADLVVCSDIDENLSCKYGAEYQGSRNVYSFEVGWIIEFPLQEFGVDLLNCQDQGGKPVFVDPSSQQP